MQSSGQLAQFSSASQVPSWSHGEAPQAGSDEQSASVQSDEPSQSLSSPSWQVEPGTSAGAGVPQSAGQSQLTGSTTRVIWSVPAAPPLSSAVAVTV